MVSQYSTRLPVIPDLRFEQSYLRSIAAYLDSSTSGDLTEHVPLDESADWQKPFDELADAGDKATRTGRGKEAGKITLDQKRDDEPSAASRTDPIPIQVVHVDWRGVAWVTVRDQLASPLLQGVLWGVASHFLRPVLSLVGARLRVLFGPHRRPQAEGSGVGWLRSWARTWTLGPGTYPK